ncbi:hypothetical protein KKP04_02390 [Rhodomicrobium sp. Az07]|uniref:hypothetical protein n=1 Tax=Rhodomicrobium sp. Az07 TaxID=2839034 RepID=UPI001BE93518|nr:hypothetical protein [Rhodomicrobium sp. Az07]MBT3069718.1 hypothetical protein [Rhodomicrobium sp. Az07]
MSVEPVSAGLSRISVAAPCFPSGRVQVRYDSLTLVRALDENGALTLLFDCYLGEKPPLKLTFPDGSEVQTQLRTIDLERVTKVALLWRGRANLDLHAFEYAADFSDVGHVWAGAPSSRWQAEERRRRDNRGHGLMTSAAEGTGEGDQLEVYTFIHETGQASGVVKLALDYESRARIPQEPDSCGTGLYADLEYRVTVWRPNGSASRMRGSFAPLPCGQPTDPNARYSSKALPQLILTR